MDLSSVNLKKYTTWELQVKFYLGQNEDCIPEESTSDSSERLLKRGRGKGQYVCDFGEGGIQTMEYIFFQKVSTSFMKISVSHEEQSSPWRILVLFQIWGDIRTGLIKSAPENIKLSEVLSCQFPPPPLQEQSASLLLSTLDSFCRSAEGQQLQQHGSQSL